MPLTIKNLYDQDADEQTCPGEYSAKVVTSWPFGFFPSETTQTFKVSPALVDGNKVYTFEFRPLNSSSKKKSNPNMIKVPATELEKAFLNSVKLVKGGFGVSISIFSEFSRERHVDWSEARDVQKCGFQAIFLKFDTNSQLTDVKVEEAEVDISDPRKMTRIEKPRPIFIAKNLKPKSYFALSLEKMIKNDAEEEAKKAIEEQERQAQFNF